MGASAAPVIELIILSRLSSNTHASVPFRLIHLVLPPASATYGAMIAFASDKGGSNFSSGSGVTFVKLPLSSDSRLDPVCQRLLVLLLGGKYGWRYTSYRRGLPFGYCTSVFCTNTIAQDLLGHDQGMFEKWCRESTRMSEMRGG